MKSRIVWWILTVLCALMILGLSSQSALQSSGLSSSLTQTVLEKVPAYQDLSPEEQEVVFAQVHKLLREIAHVVTFALLGFCASMLARSYALKCWVQSVFPSCALFAVLDESLQHVLGAGRTFQFIDLLKDWAGSLLGIAVVFLMAWVTHRRTVGGGNNGVSGSGAG
ncbi:MAG: VanZ family protein [Clostridia bacterium]|nr:VanZ family protein [Clostridia bacterium]